MSDHVDVYHTLLSYEEMMKIIEDMGSNDNS